MQKHSLNNDSLTIFANTVKAGGVVCYPTEGVWGLGCHPQSETAFARLLDIKKRPADKGVILVAANYRQLHPYVQLDEPLRQRLQTVWAGFVTCLLPPSPQCPAYLYGEHDTVAVRLTAYPLLQSLCLYADTALVSTSANITGQAPVTSANDASKLFGKQVDYYVDAATGAEAKPSRIVRFTDDKMVVIRE